MAFNLELIKESDPNAYLVLQGFEIEEESEESLLIPSSDEQKPFDDSFWATLEEHERESRQKKAMLRMLKRKWLIKARSDEKAEERKRRFSLAFAETQESLKKAEAEILRQSGIAESDEIESTRALLEIRDEDGVKRLVETKEKMGEKLASSAVFRRLATEDIVKKVLAGQSLQLKGDTVKAILQRRAESGQLELVVKGATGLVKTDNSLNLRLIKLLGLPVVKEEKKWLVFLGIKEWGSGELELRDFICPPSGTFDFRVLKEALENLSWLCVAVFGDYTMGMFDVMIENASDPRIKSVLNPEFVEWMCAALWKELWGILRGAYHVEGKIVVLQNGGWCPIWESILDNLQLNEESQLRWSNRVKVASRVEPAMTSPSRNSLSNSASSTTTTPTKPPRPPASPSTPTPSTNLCIAELAHGVGLIHNGVPMPKCEIVGCRFSHDWKSGGKGRAMAAVKGGRAKWLQSGNAREELVKQVQAHKF